MLKHRCYIINVYSKCDLPPKRRLWERLTELRRSMGDGAWCIIGDFNAVGGSDERSGGEWGGFL